MSNLSNFDCPDILVHLRELRPLGAYTGEEFPDSSELLNFIEQAIIEGFLKKRYLGGGVAIDVFLNTQQKERQNGIEIRLFTDRLIEKSYYTYEKIGAEYIVSKHS